MPPTSGPNHGPHGHEAVSVKLLSEGQFYVSSFGGLGISSDAIPDTVTFLVRQPLTGQSLSNRLGCRLSPSFSVNTWITSTRHHAQIFGFCFFFLNTSFEHQTQVLLLSKQTLYRLSHLPSPSKCYLNSPISNCLLSAHKTIVDS